MPGRFTYAQAGFDVEYASQTQKLDGGWLLLCGPGGA